MAFSYRWMFENDIVDTADHFSSAADEQLARHNDFSEKREIASRLWEELQALGWPALMVDEANGGVGGGLLDLAAMLEGAGRHALPLPLLGAFGIAPLLLNATGNAGARLGAQIVEGEAMVMPAIEGVARRAGGKAGKIECQRDGVRLVLNGRLLGVETVPGATHVLIACDGPGQTSGQPSLISCPLTQPGLSLEPGKRMDGRASADLIFDQVVLDEAMLLAAGESVAQSVDLVADLGTLLTCVEAVAAMGSLINHTIEYITIRKQFGVPLASFQVLRHYVADMVAAYEVTHALLLQTIRLVAEASDAPHKEAISLLRVRVSGAGGAIARSAIQLHGGMGVTEELLATRLARRILMAEFEYGDCAFHAERLLKIRSGEQAHA